MSDSINISDDLACQRLTAALLLVIPSSDDPRFTAMIMEKDDAECRNRLEALAAEYRLDVEEILNSPIPSRRSGYLAENTSFAAHTAE